MHIYDISWPISEVTTGYKDKQLIQFLETKSFSKDGVRESEIKIGSHSGTHVDAPSHFLRDGKTIDQITLDRLIGRCKVLDLTGITGDAITYDDLVIHDEQIFEGDIIALKTTNSALEIFGTFNSNFVYLHESGAHYFAQKKVKAVGIDYLGIERLQPDHITHTTLMHADIVVIEGLRLGHVPGGTYLIVCLPLFVLGTEAAPARAILITE